VQKQHAIQKVKSTQHSAYGVAGAKGKHMKKNIKENYSASPTDSEQLINGSYNISKVDDPIELKRLNNYIASIFSSAVPFQSKKDTLNQLRLKLNLIGFDIDIPKSLRQNGETRLSLPLKRFGGVIGVDDKGQKLNNPYGPGPKLNIEITGSEDFLTARIAPVQTAQSLPVQSEVPVASTEVSPVKEPVKENFSFSDILKYIRRK
jgi:hypothetical protein